MRLPGLKGRGVALALLMFTLFQSFFTTGIVFGWPSLLLILKNEGVYLNKCPAGTESCSSRDVAFNLVFTLASITNVIGAWVGGLIPSVKCSITCGLAFSMTGSLILALSPASSELAWPLALALQGAAGGMIQLPTYCLGNAFGSGKGSVIAAFVALFCCAALTYQLMVLLYNAGWSRSEIFLSHAGLLVCFACVTCWVWPGPPIKVGDVLTCKGCRLRVENENDNQDETATGTNKPARGLCRKVLQGACSFKYIAFLTFYIVELWFNRCLMGWFAPYLDWKDRLLTERYGHGLDIEYHTGCFTILNALLPITAIPVFGWIVARFGHRSVAPLCAALLGVLSFASLLMDKEWPLFFFYFFLAWHRQFLLSTFFNFVSCEFTGDVFPKLAGIGTLVSSLSGGLQYPVLGMTYSVFDGDFVPTLSGMLILGCLLLVVVAAFFLQEKVFAHRCSIRKPNVKETEGNNANEDSSEEASSCSSEKTLHDKNMEIQAKHDQEHAKSSASHAATNLEEAEDVYADVVSPSGKHVSTAV